MLGELRAGFAEVRSRVWIWATLASFSVDDLLRRRAPSSCSARWSPRSSTASVGAFGIVEACLGVGTDRRLAARDPLAPAAPDEHGDALRLPVAAGVIIFAAGVPLAIDLPVVVAGGRRPGAVRTWWLTALAERIPPDKLSRVTSYDWMVSLGLLPLGFVLAGPLADALRGDRGAADRLRGGDAAAIAGTLPRQTRTLRRVDRRGIPGRRAATPSPDPQSEALSRLAAPPRR